MGGAACLTAGPVLPAMASEFFLPKTVLPVHDGTLPGGLYSGLAFPRLQSHGQDAVVGWNLGWSGNIFAGTVGAFRAIVEGVLGMVPQATELLPRPDDHLLVNLTKSVGSLDAGMEIRFGAPAGLALLKYQPRGEAFQVHADYKLLGLGLGDHFLHLNYTISDAVGPRWFEAVYQLQPGNDGAALSLMHGIGDRAELTFVKHF